MALHEQISVISTPEGWGYCGDRVAIGSEVRWEILAATFPSTYDYLGGDMLADGVWNTITHHLVRAYGLTQQPRRYATRARVTSIEAVYSKRELRREARAEVRYRVAGSAVLDERERVTAREPEREREGVKFAGLYLVGLEPLEVDTGKP